MHLDLLLEDALVDFEQELSRQILTQASASIVLDELLLGHLVLDARVVEVGIQHDEREGQHICLIYIQQCT